LDWLIYLKIRKPIYIILREMNTEMMKNIDRSKTDGKPKRGALNGFNDWMRIQEHKKAYWLSQTG